MGPPASDHGGDFGRGGRGFDLGVADLGDLTAHAGEQGGGHGDLGHQGRVLHHDGDGDGARDFVEVVEQAVSVGLEEVGRKDHEGVGAQVLGFAAEVAGGVGAGVAGTDHQGNASAHLVEHQFEDRAAFGGGEGIAFAGVAEESEAVGAGLEQVLDQARLAGEVERTVVAEGGVEDWEDAFELLHKMPGQSASMTYGAAEHNISDNSISDNRGVLGPARRALQCWVPMAQFPRFSATRRSLSILLLCSAMAWAQSATTGGLAGTVTNAAGTGIPGVAVTVTHASTNQLLRATTGDNGGYNFSMLAPGAYQARFAVKGFKTAQWPTIVITVSEAPTLDAMLEEGEAAEPVPCRCQMSVTSSSTGTTVDSKAITAAPLTHAQHNAGAVDDVGFGVRRK